MEIKLKDVLHLYLGCQIAIRYKEGQPNGMAIDTMIYIDDRGCGDTNGNSYNFTEIKPMLRPLSELIDEEKCEEKNCNDEHYSFILEKIVADTPYQCDAYDEWMASYIDNPEPSRMLQAPFEIVQELIKQKYDVFNLISSGLAIDKTKI